MKVSKPYILHILQEIEYLEQASANLTFEYFSDNATLKRAFVRSLEVIGEAVKNIPDDFKQRYPDIEWRKIAGMRDKLIHHYFGVDYRLVWSAVQNEIPLFKRKIINLLSDLDR